MRFLFLSATKHNELTVTERLVYSLATRASRKFKSGISTDELSQMTGLDRLRTVPKAVERLVELGLVIKQDDCYFAQAPPEAVVKWFVKRKCKLPLHWADSLAYFIVTLTHKTNQRQIDDVLLGLLRSLAAQSDGLVRRQTPAGLAKLLGCERKRVRRSLDRLTEQGLIFQNKSPIWGTDIKLVEQQPPEDGKPSQPITNSPQKPVPTGSTTAPLQHRQDRFSELRADRRCMLTLLEAERIPGYLAGQIVSQFNKLQSDNALTWFTGVLGQALEQHRPTNEVNHCGHLLLNKCNTLVDQQHKEQQYWERLIDDAQSYLPA